MSAPEPPPFEPEEVADRKRPRFQFNTAMLLGAMALVAVVCAVAMTVPALFALLTTALMSSAYVAYASALLSGAWFASGNRRVFCVAALLSLILIFWTDFALYVACQDILTGLGTPPSLTKYFAPVGVLVVRIALSLFGGWVALRAARFWEAENDDQLRPAG